MVTSFLESAVSEIWEMGERFRDGLSVDGRPQAVKLKLRFQGHPTDHFDKLSVRKAFNPL